MAKTFDTVQSITDNGDKIHWKLKVRVMKMWKWPNFSGIGYYCINMILMDEKDEIIEACIRKRLVKDFLKKVLEGKTYVMEFFDVKENTKGDYRATNHKYMLHFRENTLVAMKVELDTQIKMHVYNFTSLD
ncbi:Nucleic acid-binding OB-fold-like protein [Euphorbia peplus]|nr:Nucleic acid-binding OB-fold-like protein [Euphorbia peplus]